MDESLYSVEQVAERLGLHVKTVRNYVKEGRLKAVRIGKSYRISASDLAALTGRPTASFEDPPIRRNRFTEVYSVAEIDAVSPALAERTTNMLMGASQGHLQDLEDQPLRVQSIYDAARGHLKVVLIGSIDTTTALLKVVKALTEADA